VKDNTSMDSIGTVKDLDPKYRRHAARTVASNATDAAECSLFLAMLGLTAEDGLNKLEQAA
jgi:hypothetical protein